MPNELKDLVEKIQYVTRLTKGQIAERAGYTREHLSVAAKNNTKGKIYETLERIFSQELASDQNENTPTHERKGTVVGEINKLTEQVIQLQAAVNVYGLTLQHLASDVKGTQVAIIAGQIADAIASEEERLRLAWKKGV